MRIPIKFDRRLALAVALGPTTIPTMAISRDPMRIHGRLAALLVVLCMVFVSIPIYRPLDPRADGELARSGLIIAILLTITVPALAQRRLGERWEKRGWSIIAAALVVLATVLSSCRSEPPQVSLGTFMLLVSIGLPLAGALILCRRSLKAERESWIWPVVALILWPFCFLLGLILYSSCLM